MKFSAKKTGDKIVVEVDGKVVAKASTMLEAIKKRNDIIKSHLEKAVKNET